METSGKAVKLMCGHVLEDLACAWKLWTVLLEEYKSKECFLFTWFVQQDLLTELSVVTTRTSLTFHNERITVELNNVDLELNGI